MPTALYYEFAIKNTGNKSIGGMEKDKDLRAKIVPNNKLETMVPSAEKLRILRPLCTK